jgi:hypothetical protein
MPNNDASASRDALPSPEEANRIAAVMGRPILATDGQYYSGEEEDIDLDPGHDEADSVVYAVNAIADCPSDPSTWLRQVDPDKLEFLWAGSVDLAIDWLTELRQKLWESRLRAK